MFALRTLTACAGLLWVLSSPLSANQGGDAVPEKAVCRTCAMRGAVHGEEDVAAWREHEGARYYFCSKDCAKAFDGFPEAYVPQPLPRPAPNASVVMLAGEEFELAELRGKVVLLDFWATWCGPCVKAMPMLDKLHTKWTDANFTVFGVSIDADAADVVPKFVTEKKIDYPIALDTAEQPAWHAFRVAAIPAMFLIDAQGRIVGEWRGDVDLARVREAVAALLAPPPKPD